jgi:polygalacturonase
MPHRVYVYVIYLLMLFTPLLHAVSYQRNQGYCQQGGQSVISPGVSASTTKVQRSFPSCTVTVYDAGTLNLSTIFSDSSGTAKANPFTASTTGYWFFNAADGSYDVNFSGTGISSPFTLGSRTIKSKLNDTVSVKDFGATGDGTTDDTAAIQAAIDSLCVGSGGTGVYIPAGKYVTTSVLTCSITTTNKGLRIYGDGPKSIILL